MDLLPEFWANVSKLNPLVYVVNAFRYGVLGVSDVSLSWLSRHDRAVHPGGLYLQHAPAEQRHSAQAVAAWARTIRDCCWYATHPGGRGLLTGTAVPDSPGGRPRCVSVWAPNRPCTGWTSGTPMNCPGWTGGGQTGGPGRALPCSRQLRPNIVESKSFKLYLNSLNNEAPLQRSGGLRPDGRGPRRGVAGAPVNLELHPVDDPLLAGSPTTGPLHRRS